MQRAQYKARKGISRNWYFRSTFYRFLNQEANLDTDEIERMINLFRFSKSELNEINALLATQDAKKLTPVTLEEEAYAFDLLDELFVAQRDAVHAEPDDDLHVIRFNGKELPPRGFRCVLKYIADEVQNRTGELSCSGILRVDVYISNCISNQHSKIMETINAIQNAGNVEINICHIVSLGEDNVKATAGLFVTVCRMLERFNNYKVYHNENQDSLIFSSDTVIVDISNSGLTDTSSSCFILSFIDSGLEAIHSREHGVSSFFTKSFARLLNQSDGRFVHLISTKRTDYIILEAEKIREACLFRPAMSYSMIPCEVLSEIYSKMSDSDKLCVIRSITGVELSLTPTAVLDSTFEAVLQTITKRQDNYGKIKQTLIYTQIGLLNFINTGVLCERLSGVVLSAKHIKAVLERMREDILNENDTGMQNIRIVSDPLLATGLITVSVYGDTDVFIEPDRNSYKNCSENSNNMGGSDNSTAIRVQNKALATLFHDYFVNHIIKSYTMTRDIAVGFLEQQISLLESQIPGVLKTIRRKAQSS